MGEEAILHALWREHKAWVDSEHVTQQILGGGGEGMDIQKTH